VTIIAVKITSGVIMLFNTSYVVKPAAPPAPC